MPAPSGVPEREGVLRLADGRALGWSEWGPADGRAVLLLHGGPGSSHACPDVAATHQLGVRLIAVDRPGYGRSDPRPGRRLLDDGEDLRALLDHSGIGGVPVVGWSTGSTFALAAGIVLGPRVERIALIAGDAPPDELPDGARDAAAAGRTTEIRRDPAAARSAMLERTAWFARDPESLLRDSWQEAPSGQPDDTLRRQPAVREMLLAMMRHAGHQGSVGWVDDSIAVQLPWGFALADLQARVAVWFGEDDRLSSRAESELLAERLPRATLHIVPGEGHLLPVRQWRAILGEVLSS